MKLSTALLSLSATAFADFGGEHTYDLPVYGKPDYIDGVQRWTDGELASMPKKAEQPPKDSCDDGQQIAIPSYIHPKDKPEAWSELLSYPRDKVSVLVANIANGPNVTVNEDWAPIISKASANGKKMLGYVATGYLGRNSQAFTTRDGSGDLKSWISQIISDVDRWYEQYGNSIGGIFFDEGLHECGANNEYSEVYKRINNYTKKKYKNAFTALNPGSIVPKCYEDTMDTLMTYENSYDTYINNYVPNNWTASDPQKIWHVVYGVPENEVQRVSKLSSERGAGLIQITDGVMPNPYNTIPGNSYMQKLMDSVDGGSTPVAGPPSKLGRLGDIVRRQSNKKKCVQPISKKSFASSAPTVPVGAMLALAAAFAVAF